jgi:amino acid adenylation domain-containing protein
MSRPLTEPAAWAPPDTERPIPHRFAEQVERQPGRPAIAGTGWAPTFLQLAEAAAAIASSLAERDGTGNGRVAILMDHDAPLMAAMLGTVNAGHAVVVLNPTDPPGRLGRIRRQVEPWLAIADRSHLELARRAGFEHVLEVPDPPSAGSSAPSAPPSEADELAAIMFTSGSTGRPKGVMHSHHSLLHTALRHSTALDLRPEDRVALLASPSGGHGMGTIWMTLLSGATLCPFPVMDRGVAGLPEWLAEHRITVLGLSASLFRRLIPALDGVALPHLRLVRLGSEQALRADFDAWREHLGGDREFANVFSLTEAGGLAHSLMNSASDPADGPLPVGRPAPGVEISLIDDGQCSVAPGEVGEIVVRSAHLTPGYWRDDRLTAERFGHPDAEGRRTIRTGDLGRLNEDGELVIVGRRDNQVQIRGYRVELDEVETALRSLPEVDGAAAQAEPTSRGDRRLVAYVAASPGAHPTPAGLREALRATLSQASIPTAFTFVDELPLTAHGKVDRELLATLSRQQHEPCASAPPESRIERVLGEIWAPALELPRIGRTDDFFDLGGDSLAAAEIGAGIYETFGVEIDLRAFEAHSTIALMAGLVRRLEARDLEGSTEISARPRDEPLPCSLAQERIWQLAKTPEGAAAYTMVTMSALRGPIDLDAFLLALEGTCARHEPLRTTFVERDGRPLQVVHPPQPLDVPITDLTGEPDPESRAAELLREHASARFDLERGPLVRFRLLRIGEDDYRLLRATHHIVTDRQSWSIFLTDLVEAYDRLRAGNELPGPRPLQYADFAAWQRDRMDPAGAPYRTQLDWWRGELARPLPALRLPFARRTPVMDQTPEDGDIWWGLDPSVTRALDLLARTEGTTRYTVRLAVFSALLALETGRDQVVIGTYVDNRTNIETQQMFGYFVNVIPLVLPFDPAAPLRHWLKKVRFVIREARARAEIPHEDVLTEMSREGRPAPEITAIFGMRRPPPELPFGDAEWRPATVALLTMPWGFTFTVDQRRESDRCQVAFDANLHDPLGVREFINGYADLAEAAGARPDDPLGDLHVGLGQALDPGDSRRQEALSIAGKLRS